MKRKVAIYTRVSTKEQLKQGYSIQQQADLLIKKAKQIFPDDEYEIYSDEGISGKNIEARPGMKRLLEDIENRQIKVVMSWKLNRLSRSNRDIQNIIYEFRRGGAYYISISENIDTSTQNGEMMIGAFGLVAQIERETIVSNVKMGMNAKAKQGEAITGRVLGYVLKPNPLTGKNELVIDEFEANIVRQIFDLYLNQNKGLKAIANYLNKQGYHTINKKPFSVYGVKYILNNPVYKGYVRFNNYQNWAVERRSGKNDKSKVILVQGKHKAIIDEEIFDKTHEKLAAKSFKPGRPIGGDFWLRGLIKCPECGNNMVCRRPYYNTKKSNERTLKRYYICSLFNRAGSAACHSNAIKAEVVERVVYFHLRRILSQPHVVKTIATQVIDAMEKKKANQTPMSIDTNSLENQKKKLQKRKERLIDLYLDEEIDKETMQNKQDKLNVQLEKIDEQLKQAEVMNKASQDIAIPNYKKIKGQLYVMLYRFTGYMKKANPEAKNKLMHMLIDSIELTTDKQVKLIKYKIDESLLPQSIKKDCGNFFMPKFNFVINVTKKNRIENLSLLPLF
ncbi:cassette chromosome recombinase CcrC [Staphylococcus aureus]|uniref:cassette chromosome recombinase CcrC n=1 Tax=Staphylococcus aureus TaxID=1280 RepID=UPI000DE1B9BE|nr:recombinase family protein [Staphylococcus aureus]